MASRTWSSPVNQLMHVQVPNRIRNEAHYRTYEDPDTMSIFRIQAGLDNWSYGKS